MLKNPYFQLAWPHAIAVAVLIAISAFYFSPIMKGYDLEQSDIVQWKGMSQELMNYRMLHDEEGLWTNSMFGGMPGYQVSTEHNANILRPILLFFRLGLPGAIGTLFLCFIGYYILGLCLRLGPWYSLIGSVAFGLATINILYLGAGHTGKVTAIAFMAPTLGGLILALRGNRILGSAVFMLFLGLNIAANHLQMTYYLAFLLVAVAVGEGVKFVLNKKFKELAITAGFLGLATVAAVLPSASNLMATQEYGEYTTRGSSELTIKPESGGNTEQEGLSGSYILDYNYASGEQWGILIPNIKGGVSKPLTEYQDEIGSLSKSNKEISKFNKDWKQAMQGKPTSYFQLSMLQNGVYPTAYWGDQNFTGGAFYFGAFILTLMVLGLVGSKDSLKWPFLIIGILALMLCQKEMTGMNEFFINKIPLYNKFRDSKMILVLIQVMAGAMAMLFLKDLKEGQLAFGGKAKKVLIGASAVWILALGYLYLSPSAAGEIRNEKEIESIAKIKEAAPQMLKEQLADSPDQINAQLAAFNEEAEDYEGAVYSIRKEIAKKDSGRSLLLAFLGVLVIGIFLFVKNKSVHLAMLPVVGLIVLFDQLSVSRRYLNTDMEKGKYASFIQEGDKQLPVKPTKADVSILLAEKKNVSTFDEEVKKLKQAMDASGMYGAVKNQKNLDTLAQFGALGLNTDYRVLKLGNPFNEARTSYYHKSIGGYHGAKLKRYNELIDFYLSSQIQSVTAFQQSKMEYLQSLSQLGNVTQAMADSIFMVLDSQEMKMLKDQNVLNMLNTKYIIFSPEADANVNKWSCGNAWFVSEVKQVNSADEEMLGLKDLNVYNTAVAQSKYQSVFHSGSSAVDSTSSVILKKYATNELVYEAVNNAGSEMPIVFSEIYYPKGWKCTVDGQEVEYAPVNYVLRGIMMPAGKHEVVWKFEPEVWTKGNTISTAGSILFCLLLGLSGFGLWRNRKQVGNEEKSE
jgi:hypothetical protein